jgi:predicted transcriptional regulator YdeE
MKVMVIVKASQDSEAGVMPSEELLTAMGNYNEELVNAGIMLAGEGLHPSSKGVRVRFSGKDRAVIDGPFAETKELIAGYWLWKVNSMDEAVEWLKKCPNPHDEVTEVEIRPVFEAEDFGEAFTPELREQEAVMRAQTLGLGAPRFENVDGRVVAGLNETYTFESRVNIPKQWDRFAPQLGNVPGQAGPDAYGVSWNYQPGSGFDYLAGVAVADAESLPADLAHVELPAGRYVVFTHRDHIATLPRTIDTIWMKWVPDSGLQLADAPTFERYTERFDPATGKGDVEIWIPLAQ